MGASRNVPGGGSSPVPSVDATTTPSYAAVVFAPSAAAPSPVRKVFTWRPVRAICGVRTWVESQLPTGRSCGSKPRAVSPAAATPVTAHRDLQNVIAVHNAAAGADVSVGLSANRTADRNPDHDILWRRVRGVLRPRRWKTDHHACALTNTGRRLHDKALPNDETALRKVSACRYARPGPRGRRPAVDAARGRMLDHGEDVLTLPGQGDRLDEIDG